MRGIPFWKIKRELMRPLRQSAVLPQRVFTYYLGAPYNDLFLAKEVQHFEGRLSFSSRVAIYLIFPDKGLQPSHLHSLSYIASRGYAPLVVSNLKLSKQDRSRLLDKCWKYVERPNFGYDFGGYREGVLTLSRDLRKLDRLVILNDSSWFPVNPDYDWLTEAEATGLDYVGAASNYGTPRIGMADYSEQAWEYCSTHKNFHYCSFALSLSPRLIRDPGFHKFWRLFPLTNDKTRVVRRGEIGLSQWVISRKFTHGSTLRLDSLDRDLAALSDGEIQQLTRNLVIPAHDLLCAAKVRLLAEPVFDRSKAENLILTATSLQGASYALPAFSIPYRHFAFLKKSPVWLNRDSSDATLCIADSLPGETGKAIVDEIRKLRQSRLKAA